MIRKNYSLFIFVFISLIGLIPLYGQSPTTFFQNYDKNENSTFNSEEANENFNLIRINPSGTYDKEWLKQSRDSMLTFIKNQNRIANMLWEERGPDNVGGKTRAICIDRNNDNHVFCGSVVGGLFESWNGGVTWNVVSGFYEYLRISTMTQTLDGTYYVGTGSSFDNWSGDGIWSSTDNGITWIQVPGSSSWTNINEITVDGSIQDKIWITGLNSIGGFQSYTPSNGFVIAPGMTDPLWLDCKSSPDGQIIIACKYGLEAFVSIDAGNTFNSITGVISSNQIPSTGTRMEFGMSFEKNSNNKWTVYASTSTNDLSGVFISESNGEPNTWFEIAQSNTVQTSFTPFSYSGGGLFGQGTYNHILSGVPGNPDHCLLGGIEMYKWKKTSSNPITGQWTQQTSWDFNSITPPYASTQEHELKWDQNSKLYMGSDGGITKSFDFGEQSWVPHKKGLNITMIYGIGFNKYDHIIGGTANEGTQVNDYSFPSTGLEFIELPNRGEGFDCDFSHIAPNVIFYSKHNGTYFRTDSVAGGINSLDTILSNTSGYFSVLRLSENTNDLNSQDSIQFIANQNYLIGDTILYYSQNQEQEIVHILNSLLLQGDTIMLQDPVQSLLAMGGANSVRITRQALRFDVTPELKTLSISGSPSCIEFSSDGNYMYVATSNTLIIFKNLNTFYSPANDITGITSTTISGLGSIQGIGVDPNDPDHIVVAANNTLRECINATSAINASSFMDITTTLPALTTYDAIIDYQNPNKMVMGTEFGLYATDDGGINWTYQQGPGFVPVYEVRQQWRNDSWNAGIVYAGTFGRGIWSSRSFVGIHEKDNTEAINSHFTEVNSHPNPMNTEGIISFILKEKGKVDIFLMDLVGKIVMTKNLGELNSGENSSPINIKNLAAGTYILMIKSGNEFGTDKLVITH